MGGDLWLIGQKTAGAALPLADTGAGAGRSAAPRSTSQARVLIPGLAVKTPGRVWGWGDTSWE